MAETSVRRIVIAGSGPAGLTAAIYAARAGLSPLMLDGPNPGGQLVQTTEIENFPGFPDGIMGPELIMAMRRQAEKFGAEFSSASVSSVDFSSRPFLVTAGDETWRARAFIIATGASARWLDLPAVERLRGRGVSACATCDGFFFRGKSTWVIGGGDTALEDAMFLCQFAREVHLVHRRDELRASKIMQDQARADGRIVFHYSATVDDIVGDEKVTAIRLKDVTTGAVTEHQADGIFCAIGHDPATGPFAALERDAAGYLVTIPDKTATKIEGVFACGDVRDPVYRQATTAAGDGCRAALEAEKFLIARGEAHG